MALKSPLSSLPPLPDRSFRSSQLFSHEEPQVPLAPFNSGYQHPGCSERAASSPQPAGLPCHVPSYIVASPDLHASVLTFKPEGSHSHSHTSSLSAPGSSTPPCGSPSSHSLPHSLLSHPALTSHSSSAWPAHGPPSTMTSVNAAYLEARRIVALRASQERASGGAPAAESEEEESESETEHDQVTKLLLAAVLSSEKSKAQHARHHSWSHARHQAQSHRGPSRLSSDLPPTPQHPNEDDVEEEGSRHPSPPARVRSSYHLTSGQAAVELFLRLSHARQTVDFSKRQAALFSTTSHVVMSTWEALEMLDELREFEAVLLRSPDPGRAMESMRDGSAGPGVADMTLMEHAFQTAELCRLHYGPQKDHMHLAGLIHGLGKLLAHARFGTQPQWAVCGESFPCGCRFAPGIQGAQYFSANSDRRRRLYNTQCGMYPSHCGLSHVTMSWGAAEYLHQVLQRNHCKLPPEAMFCLRFQKFFTLADGAYNHLLDAEDRALLPSLTSFQQLCDFKRRSASGIVTDKAQLKAYYSRLMAKYLPDKLSW